MREEGRKVKDKWREIESKGEGEIRYREKDRENYGFHREGEKGIEKR